MDRYITREIDKTCKQGVFYNAKEDMLIVVFIGCMVGKNDQEKFESIKFLNAIKLKDYEFIGEL